MEKTDLTMKVKISTPTNVLWEGEAVSISSKNSQGAFDILPRHANFVTLIQGTPIIVREEHRERQYSFINAVIHADMGEVKIYGDV